MHWISKYNRIYSYTVNVAVVDKQLMEKVVFRHKELINPVKYIFHAILLQLEERLDVILSDLDSQQLEVKNLFLSCQFLSNLG